jgi:hypothetical protein
MSRWEATCQFDRKQTHRSTSLRMAEESGSGFNFTPLPLGAVADAGGDLLRGIGSEV